MKKNAGGGRENIDGAYTKSALSPNLPNEGAVYAVAGSSGKISGGLLNHPAMFVSLNNLGSMVLDVNGDRLDAKFLRENSTIADYFTIIKGGTPPGSPPNAPSGLSASTVSASQINLNWTDASANEDGFKIERCEGATCTNFAQIATVGANINTFSNTGLNRNTTYRYRVRAYNTSGDSNYSNIASAKTFKR
jgi:hypothetical protein